MNSSSPAPRDFLAGPVPPGSVLRPYPARYYAMLAAGFFALGAAFECAIVKMGYYEHVKRSQSAAERTRQWDELSAEMRRLHEQNKRARAATDAPPDSK